LKNYLLIAKNTQNVYEKQQYYELLQSQQNKNNFAG